MLRKRNSSRGILALCAVTGVLLLAVPTRLSAQNNSGMIQGTVTDPSKAAVPGAKVRIENPVSHHVDEVQTDANGAFRIPNIPFNPYHLTVTAPGFSNFTQDVDVRSTVPITMDITLMLGSATTNITVTAENAIDLIEQDSTAHTDIDRGLFDKLPLESPSSSVSSLITLASPGVAADSNGLFHGMGDHAESSFSIDGQPITDQQSKVFSNQVPVDSIQSLEVIDGAPPAEYGDKTSLIINVTTRSGLGVNEPKGDATVSYGSFGTAAASFDMGFGGTKWGNFISASGLNTSRFLDPPEFQVFHDQGNEENLFDRVDYKPSNGDSLQLNLQYTRSYFQNPNSYDQEYHSNPVLGLPLVFDDPLTGAPLAPTDQRSQIKTFNIAPTWTRLIGTDTVFTFGGFLREDQYNYYPSGNPFDDFSPDLQAETFGQSRALKNAGLRTDVSYVKGIHNLKAGAILTHWFLTETDDLGIVQPGFLADMGCPNPAIPACAVLLPFDLTQGGSVFSFRGHADIREQAIYAQDTITKGNWTFNLGLRGDFYDGFSRANQAEPRLGFAYKISPSNTVLRVSYARTQETPFNENLIIGSTGCQIPVIADLVPPPGVPCEAGPITPGWRNEFHAGLQQAFGKYLVLDGQYIWKYTHNAYDFGVVGNTPLAFPIEWQKSKITGFTFRASVPNYRGLTADVVMSSVAARFFLPQVAGVPIVPPATGVFRIDHDEVFNQTTHVQYQPRPNLPWIAFTWRYDSGFVSGAVPCLAATATCAFTTSIADGGANPTIASGQVALLNNVTGVPLTADQEFQAGLTCDGKPAAPSPTGPALAVCDAAGLGSTLVKIPAPGTENDDHNPQRIQPRSLFDASVGDDNLFNRDHYKWSLRLTVINLTNKDVLYNFLSTFSGTHYVTPRTETVELGFHF
jgi:Carboxypeptidase regulatory-like domain/TonB-dependent Receptor Plug Domain